MKRAAFISVAFAVLCFAGCVSVPVEPPGKRGISWYWVERVLSGDSIAVKGVGRVKYIGVWAPGRSITGRHNEKLWKESLDKNRELVEGKWVRLEFDKRREDNLGRFLAYVFVQQDYRTEIFVNGEMLRVGLARLEESTVNTKLIRRLEALESRARGQRLGIWSD